MEETSEKKGNSAAGKQVLAKRSWPWAVAFSVVVAGLGIAISATVSPLFGRAEHWDWMAVLAAALRNRWA